jgi:putative pyoverdin transport system ATP-binding/permease protein
MNSLKLFRFLLGFSRARFLLAVVAGMLGGAANVYLIALINKALSRRASSMTGSSIVIFAALCLLMLVSQTLSQALLIHLGQKMVLELRYQISRKILALSLRELETLGSSALLANLTDDVTAITNYAMSVPGLCMSVTVLLGCMLYLAWLSILVVLTVIVFMACALVIYRIAANKGTWFLYQARVKYEVLVRHFNALTAGAKELRLSDARSYWFKRDFRSVAEEVQKTITKGMVRYNAAGTYGYAVYFLLVGLLVLELPRLVSLPLTMEVLTGTAITLLYMRGPLEYVVTLAPNMARAQVAFERLKVLEFGLWDSKNIDIDGGPPALCPHASFHSVEVNGISHQYQSTDGTDGFSVGPISLQFHPGSIVFITGGNGSGKTTLAKLLTGLYVPDEGEIFLDGKLITDDNRREYRQYFSAIFSDFHLFSSLPGEYTADVESKAQQCLRDLRLNNSVQIKDGRFSTIDLSQGQRKRLALLMAYMEDRPIYVFDEWAADQDRVFRDIFYHTILPDLKARGKLVLVISHDERYYPIGDAVIYLENGKLDSGKAWADVTVAGNM